MSDRQNSAALELIEATDMAPDIDHAIKKLLCECFTDDAAHFSRTRYWHGTAPSYSLIYSQDNQVLGHVGVVLRTVDAGGVQTDIAGIQNLAVSPQIRGSMVSWALMRRSMKEAKKNRSVPFGLLFCVPALEELYAAMKWKRIDAVVTMRDEEGNTVGIPGKNIAMVLELADRPFPEGNIDLQGMDW